MTKIEVNNTGQQQLTVFNSNSKLIACMRNILLLQGMFTTIETEMLANLPSLTSYLVMISKELRISSEMNLICYNNN